MIKIFKNKSRVSGLILAFSFSLCLFSLPSQAQASPLPKNQVALPQVISAIKISGNQTISSNKIMDVIFSRVGDSLVDEKINSDQKAIYGLGYFADVSADLAADKNGTIVTFKVIENPRLDKIIIDGNSVYSTAEISAMLSSKQGEILNFKNLQDDIEKINTKYKAAGYMLARVVDVKTDEAAKQLHFKITEGRVESITLDGNEQTQNYVILRELDTVPGSVVNENTLKKDLRRVFNLGFFSEVNPSFEPGTTKDSVALVLKIKESRSSTINFGGGYGERDGWFGFIDLSINNLFGTAQGMMIRGQSGQQLTTYQFKYYNPWFIPDKLGKRAAFTFKRWYTIGRDIYLTDQDGIYNGFEVSLGRPFLENYNIAWSLGSELVTPHNNATFEAYQSDTVGLTFSYDTRDYILNPKEGRFYSLAFKQGWKYSSGNSSFFKMGLDLNHYYSVYENQVLATHIGSGIGFGDIPVGEEYWAGGANTIRGYNPSEAKKGTRKIITNIEYRLDFSDMFQGVFFFDWGDAWYNGAPVPANFISGWGPGVRINTPLGPIRLDWGVPGGKTFGEGVMHFSIGQAF
ncbi:hypothetical protein COT42_07755 [Candidatus Saganbacteria bacterium CG08_land_8_20_14_0_20_45_16]|uniref:POTRA domain-containing protein n=1 Tax=Candidatus Saganbacteria bacterium CG08_land_8_20_14_0_20_45_16 TaxID=2014293 RepID=A0A2H0XWJ5_UNCSA|nr:MAG: hypothetical protein COT42_07755 [Candidatus Saganbacteria bacterium CG08_land_8_20_14_0_20_45_16]